MRCIVARQGASVRGAFIPDRRSPIRRHHVCVEIHERFRKRRRRRTHPMRGVTYRATEPVLGNVQRVLVPVDFARTLLGKSWHFPHIAYGPFTVASGFGYRFVINCPGAGDWLNSYRRSSKCDPLRSMRPVRARAAELAVIVAVVAIAAKQCAYPRVVTKAARSSSSYSPASSVAAADYNRGCVTRMARRRGLRELRNDVERITTACTTRTGGYPKTASRCFPRLVPWQRRQVSY